MRTYLLLILTLFTTFVVSAQTENRISIQGTIEVPQEDEAQGITVFNTNTNRGTVTNNLGEFNIDVAVNDSLQISAVQFQKFTVIINEGVINSRQLNIFVNEVINQLPEVVVSPYELTGNVNVDIVRLDVVELPDTLNAREVQNTYFEADAAPNYQSPPRNTAMTMGNTRMVNGLNFVNLFKELLVSNRREQVYSPAGDVTADVRGLYNDEFFRENLNIEEENISDFIFYADDNGLNEQMLREGNELDLIEFLIQQSKKYKKQNSRN